MRRERKLDLFPLQRITSSDVIWARTSQNAACSAACQTVKILFAPREIDQWFGNGMEEENTPKQGAIRRRASTKRRALFASEADLALSTVKEVTNADPEPKPLLKTRDACMQTKPQLGGRKSFSRL